MNYTFRDVSLTQEEFFELKQCVGEFRRICRDQTYRHVGGEYLKSENEINSKRLNMAENLVAFLENVEWKNNNIK